MVLTRSEAEKISGKLADVFMMSAGLVHIEVVGVGIVDENKARQLLEDAREKNNMDIHGLSPIFNVTIMSKSNLTGELQRKIRDMCENIAGRKLAKDDIVFVSGFKAGIH